MESAPGYRAQRGSDTLYKQFRTGFVHDLGLLLDTVPQKLRGVNYFCRSATSISAGYVAGE
jgi:hypothetical protein